MTLIPSVDGPVQGYLRVFCEPLVSHHGYLANTFFLVIVTINMLIKLSAVIFYTPVFIVPAILTALLGATIGQMYIKAQMSVKRELSNAKSPVLSVFGGAMSGLSEFTVRGTWRPYSQHTHLVSIRAYGVQQYFRSQLLEHIDHYIRANRAFNNLQRCVPLH